MPTSLDFLSAVLGFVFTLLILSYLIGDNLLFRVAVYTFVGLSAGYVGVIVWQQVIVSKLLAPMINGDLMQRILLVPPLLLSVFLLGKISPRLQAWGRPVVAFLVGIGAAVALGGAALGTLLPQAQASINLFDFAAPSPRPVLERALEAVFILAGTVLTLAYFHFTVRAKSDKRPRLLTWAGEAFLSITFGVLFAGVLLAALSAFVDRMAALVHFFDLVFLFSF